MSVEAIEDEVETLKVVFDRQGYNYGDGEYSESEFDELGRAFNLPESYLAFLKHLEPGGNEIRYAERHSVVFFPLEDLHESQDTETLIYNGFIFGSMDDEPLVLSLEDLDESGEDCAVYRSGEDESHQLASSFYQYLQMFRVSLEMLHSLGDYDDPLRWSEEQSEADNYMNDFDEYQEPAGSREQLLEDYYEELSDIDPDCAEAWVIDQEEPALV